MLSTSPASAELLHAIDAACDRIAPTWPLDQFIAVNPYWGWRGLPIGEAAARLGVLAGTPLTMPRAWFREQWNAGRLDERHLEAAAEALGAPELAAEARALLTAPAQPAQPVIGRLALVTDLRDLAGGPVGGRSWTDAVVHQIGQHCAAMFDEWQATWAPDRGVGLFDGWRVDPSLTQGFRWPAGRDAVRARLDHLPAAAPDAISAMLDDLGVGPDGHEAYLTALLASVNGWAAWCAYRRWQARLVGGDDDTIVALLAIRLAWDWLLATDIERNQLDGWARRWAALDGIVADQLATQRLDWVLQAAIERTHQDGIVAGLPAAVRPTGSPDVEAVFCIDVRSEVFRRALEQVAPELRTRGFAGFFGLPISYTPAGSALTRPQLPGLLSPALAASEVAPGSAGEAELAAARARGAERSERWEAFRHEPSSMFSFVESMGLRYGVKLVKDSLPHRHAPAHWEHDGLPTSSGEQVTQALRPRLALVDDDPAAAAALGLRILTAMGRRDEFPPLVLLCGHGSTTANNPHAAGLDCGACGGQTGEVNARALADLLNTPAVRGELAALGVVVPDDTWFVPGLHDTTTDTVTLFDTDAVPGVHADRLARLRGWLRDAGDRARAERAGHLGLGELAAQPRRLERRLQERANDWSQVRPEWGLAGNAAFVVAPRWRTRHLDLAGRCFLHDYDWQLDLDRSVLTLIMTAPMVVTNWINLQYHASTVDNRRYGSGNKTLHNVVGGRIGVFEGNGGDLRIGLSMQSLHDGQTLRHPPLRLSVFIEAQRDAIDAVIEAHTVVADLVVNGWLHLLRIAPSSGAVERRTPHGWEPVEVG